MPRRPAPVMNTPRGRAIMDEIAMYRRLNGYPPSVRELAQACGIPSTGVVSYYLDRLEQEGYIERDRRISRGIRIKRNGR